MPRGRITKLVKIHNESLRKIAFAKRKASLYKKAEKLKTVCGVNVFLTIFNQDNKSLAFWPSEEEAEAGMEAFLSFPETKRKRKMVVQEKYLEGAINDMNAKIKKLSIMNKEKEMDLLMNDIEHSKKNVSDLNLEELHDLEKYFEDKFARLMKRSEELDEEERERQEGGGAGPSVGGGAGADPSGGGGTYDDEAGTSSNEWEEVYEELNQEPQQSSSPSN